MTNKRMRVWVRAVFVALVTAVFCVPGGVASANRADHGHRGDRGASGYLALGDSIPFGYSPYLEDPWIPERFVGYPEIIGQQRHLKVTNLACPGQTAEALISRDAPDNGCFDFRDFARDEGIDVLHTDYPGTQLEAALDAVRSGTRLSLISIQGGGNEFTPCVFDNPDPNADPKECLDEVLPKVTESLRSAAEQLRAAGYRGQIVIVGYQEMPGLEPLFRDMNHAIHRAARHAHVAFADVAGPFERYARRHNGDICSTGLLIAFPDGSCDIHPTPKGRQLYANAVLDAAGRGHDHHGWQRHRGRHH